MLKFILLPIVGAFIGWITNFIAIKMLFRPLEPVNVLGFKIQGLAAKRRYEIGEKIGETVEKELVSVDDIKRIIKDVELEDVIRNIVRRTLHGDIKERILDLIPLPGLIDDELFNKIEGIINDEIANNIDPIIHKVVNDIEDKASLKEIVVEKLKNYDIERLEDIVLNLARRELRLIEILGGILGFFIGLTQLILLEIYFK
jgi:uncharacterized membrane protein YheB (UPF0754 family)